MCIVAGRFLPNGKVQSESTLMSKCGLISMPLNPALLFILWQDGLNKVDILFTRGLNYTTMKLDSTRAERNKQ